MLIQQFHSSQIQAVPSTDERTWFSSYAIPMLIATVLAILLWPTVENENLDLTLGYINNLMRNLWNKNIKCEEKIDGVKKICRARVKS